jgi:hypothetical protein
MDAWTYITFPRNFVHSTHINSTQHTSTTLNSIQINVDLQAYPFGDFRPQSLGPLNPGPFSKPTTSGSISLSLRSHNSILLAYSKLFGSNTSTMSLGYASSSPRDDTLKTTFRKPDELQNIANLTEVSAMLYRSGTSPKFLSGRS